MLSQWPNWFDFLESIDHYIYVPYNLHTLQFSCTESVSEIADLTRKYTQFLSDKDTIWFNLFYSGGNIFKGSVNIAMYFIA